MNIHVHAWQSLRRTFPIRKSEWAMGFATVCFWLVFTFNTKLFDSSPGYAPLAAGAAGEAEKAKRQALLDTARAQGMRTMAAEWAKGMVHPQRLQDEALMEAILGMCERKTADQFAAQIRALLARPDGSVVLQSLQALQVPTLIACGRQDAWAPVAQHEAMHRLAPGAALEFVEDAGHMAPMERPAETAAVINRWLAPPTGIEPVSSA